MAASTACATCSRWSVWPGITWSISSGIHGQLAAEWSGQLHRNLHVDALLKSEQIHDHDQIESKLLVKKKAKKKRMYL